MCKLWVGEVAGAAASGNKAGVMILLRKNEGLISSDNMDSEERRVSAVIEGTQSSFHLTNIYSPNSPTKSYFQALINWLSDHLHQTHFLGGDFNSTMNDQEDRSRIAGRNPPASLPTASTPLLKFVSAMQLIDLWWQFHPIDREFTHYSHVHGAFSRIDYFFSNAAALSSVENSHIHEIAISGYAPVSIL